MLKELKIGDEVNKCLVIRKIDLKDWQGKPYLSLELGDNSGRINGVYWEANAKDISSEIKSGDVAKVKGTISVYKNDLQVQIKFIEKANVNDYNKSDFLPSTSKNTDEMFSKIESTYNSFTDNYLKELFIELFDEEFKIIFKETPGAKLWHHPYLGGLLEHTTSVLTLCEKCTEIYPLLNKDILLAGAILHDIGKTKEFMWDTFIDYSTTGRLVGHIALGIQILDQKVNLIENFPAELYSQLQHIILSHHGEKEKGSPILPATLEALIVFYCDYLDGYASAFTRIINNEKPSGKQWSNYVNLIERYIYLGEGEA